MAWHGRCRTSRGAGRRSVIQKLEGERLITADQLEIVAIERVQVGPHPARTEGQQDVVEHLLNLALATGLTTGDQGHQFAGLLPVFEERRDQPPDALEGPDLALDQTHGPVVQSSRVEFLDDDAGQVGLKDKGQELSLEPGRAGGRPPRRGPAHGTGAGRRRAHWFCTSSWPTTSWVSIRSSGLVGTGLPGAA